MKVKSLDGYEYKLSFKKKRRKTSDLHKQAVNLIRQEYPFISVAQEVTIRLDKTKKLYLDIFLPVYAVGIEVHGRQHDEHIHHFHKTRREFLAAQHRDKLKLEWCELNEITLLYFRWNETTDEWRRKLKERIG